MQDGDRSRTANETVRFLNQQRYLIQSITAFGALWSEMFTAEEDLKTP